MNEHVAKPIEPEKFYSTLAAWLPQKNAPGLTGEAAITAHDDGGVSETTIPSVFESIDGLDTSVGLRTLLGDGEYYINLLCQFAETHKGDADLLLKYAASGDFTAVRQTAHSLKGVAGTLGAARVQDLAAEFEKFAKDEAPDKMQLMEYLSIHCREISSFMDALQAACAQSRSPERPAVPVPEDIERAGEVLNTLELLLSKNDTAANDLFEDSKDVIFSVLGENAKELQMQINEFDYFNAIVTLRACLNRKS
jgi:HPt (histidine-containing phosphotransfer) domain-containing protein